ncbi:hypothetical protein FIBSPDRAFT_882831 [Athelia psychrophila]|uniref:Uncharacterized protein n=1 Tax=Athelia psychrophila TaxID=1759441 RepID=A0A166URG1_9AGAM|nr:hypothetical protein FIBSPDRAFT_882831 [Fibularhizoctonia sp. CBS 109695]
MSLPSKIIDIFDTAVVLVTGASTSRESSSLLSLAHIEWSNNRFTLVNRRLLALSRLVRLLAFSTNEHWCLRVVRSRSISVTFWGEDTRCSSVPSLAHIEWCNNRKSVCMFISARFLVGMGLSFADIAAPIPVTQHVQDQQHLVLADPLDFAGIAECVTDLSGLHVDYDENDGLMQYEFDGIKSATELSRTVNANSSPSGNGLFNCYPDEVLDRINSTSPAIKLLISSTPAIWSLFWALLASPLVDKHRRRFLFLTSCTGMFIFFLAQTICIQQYQAHQKDTAAHGTISFIFLLYAAYNLAFATLIVSYTMGILPYHLRAKGSHVNQIAPGTLKWKYHDGSLTPPPLLRRLSTQSGSRLRACSSASTSSKRKTSSSSGVEVIKWPEQVAYLAEGKNVGSHEMKEGINENFGCFEEAQCVSERLSHWISSTIMVKDESRCIAGGDGDRPKALLPEASKRAESFLLKPETAPTKKTPARKTPARKTPAKKTPAEKSKARYIILSGKLQQSARNSSYRKLTDFDFPHPTSSSHTCTSSYELMSSKCGRRWPKGSKDGPRKAGAKLRGRPTAASQAVASAANANVDTVEVYAGDFECAKFPRIAE